MRTRIGTCLIIVVLLISALPAIAQSQRDLSNPSELSEKIRRLEGMDVRKMAPSTLEIYQRTLLRLYEQYLTLLQKQIDVLTKDSNSNAQDREALIRERRQVTDHATVLRMSLGLPENESVAASSTAPTSGSNDSPIPAAKPSVSFSHAPTAPLGAKQATVATPKSESAELVASTNTSMTDATAMTPTPPAAVPVASCTPEYTNVPPILRFASQTVANSIILNNDAQELGSADFELIFYTIADALKIKVVSPLSNEEISIDKLEPYRYLGETLRTDKQLGSSTSSASVSGIDKPGFAWLLGFGIENGLVEKSVRDSVLTLSSSPAAFYMLDGNSSNPYQSAGVLNKIGVAASFNIGNTNQLLANVTRSQLREYSIKFRFIGDRSARSPQMQKIWDGVAKDIQRRLRAINDASAFISQDPVLSSLPKKMDVDLQPKISSLLKDASFKSDAGPNGEVTQKQIDAVAGLILCYLSQNVYSKGPALSPTAVARFKEVLVPNLISAQLNLKTVRNAFNAKIAEFFKGPLGTVAYINHREPTLGNYSEFKMLFEHPTPILGPLALQKLTANAGFSFYHQPNPLLKQERLRSVNGALSFEGSVASPFSETADLSRITYSLVGSYQRMFENSRVKGRKPDLSSFQFLMDVPLFKGLALPFSLTYSNATETTRQRGWHANFGLKMDTDKLLELVRAGSQR